MPARIRARRDGGCQLSRVFGQLLRDLRHGDTKGASGAGAERMLGWRSRSPARSPAPVVKVAPPRARPATTVSAGGGQASTTPAQAASAPAAQRYVPAVQLGDPRDIAWPVFAIPLGIF